MKLQVNYKNSLELQRKPVFTKDSKTPREKERSLGHPREREIRTSPKEDLVKAYQIPINEEDIHKNCNNNPHSDCMRVLECNSAFVMAVSTFQRFVDEVLRGLNFVYAFIDDILVASSSEAEHIQQSSVAFQRLDQYGLL
ncbi:transposon Tf2-6 polyprotein [Trichonephila clavipes]|nr:transposon Tf2-6 polyprotein [Trichonephila clavipes]